MKSQQAELALEQFLQDRGIRIQTPRDAVRSVIDFYRDVPADDCNPEDDGDMLLVQWGTWDWGDGPHFDFDITRQLIRVDADGEQDIWQLHVTFRFAMTDDLRALGFGDRWCSEAADLGEFASFIYASTAFAAVADRTDGRLEISYDRV